MALPLAHNPALTVALALAAGMAAQALARHLRLPGIVLLLGAGILLGPDVLGLVHPESLGEGLDLLVGFAVAVILFEGGLSLDWRRLKEQAKPLRLLVTVGALITGVGGALAAHWLLDWDWRLAALFGSLVTVTGPTVVTPLLRRIRVKARVATVLEAEGVLIDAVGAVLAVVVLEVVLRLPTGAAASGLAGLPLRLGAGVGFGLAGGALLALLLKRRGVVPEGLENVFALAVVMALFQVSNALVAETGVVAAVVAGMVMGNVDSPLERGLREFDEQLTVMLIGMLFVLLAADVRHADAVGLGGRGLAVVAVLALVVRPVNVFLCTLGSELNWRERVFLAWLAPRGIVAAAVASLFDRSLAGAGIEGGSQMRALVFLVIALTVLVQGLGGGLVARLLGLRRPRDSGWALLGANPLGMTMGRLLRAEGEELAFLDASDDHCSAAQAEGFTVLHGNALSETLILRAQMESRRGALGLASNEAVNVLFAAKALRAGAPRGLAALQQGYGTLQTRDAHDDHVGVLFGGPIDLALWISRLRRETANIRRWRLAAEPEGDAPPFQLPREQRALILPLVLERDGRARPVDDAVKVREGDVVCWLLAADREAEAANVLRERGWTPLEDAMDTPHTELLNSIDAALAAAPGRDAALAATCKLIHGRLDGYDWVGFYLVDPASPRELVLGPYVGDATDHVRIPFGRGICGQVAESEQTLVVEDVSAEANYLACSTAVRSEIVVPILTAAGRFVGQLDVDSHALARFGAADRAFCEAVCARLAPFFEEA